MPRVIHIIGGDAPAEMFAQVLALGGPDETIVSIGPPRGFGQIDRKIISLRAPLDISPLVSLQFRKLIGDADLIHAWSPAAAEAAQWSTRGKSVLLSLANLRGVHQSDIAIAGVFDGMWSLTVPTGAQRRVLITLGIDPHRVFVLPPPAEPNDNAEGDRSSARDKLGLDNGQFLLLAAGEMIHGNGHKRACWAHAMSRILTDQTRLIFPGCGPSRQAIETFARTTEHEHEIFFSSGRLSRAEAFAASDTAIFLQDHDCGVGAIIDAMARGLPILASDLPEISDCAPHGQASLLSPPGDMRQATDNLLTLLRDTKLREKLGREASILASKHFTRDIVATSLGSIYSTVVSGRS
jgi:glycosyltransferase involved in cell wall biosynthesis